LFISVIEDAYISIKYVKKEDEFYGNADANVPVEALARRRFHDPHLKLSDVR
jgi:hypothetical protein